MSELRREPSSFAVAPRSVALQLLLPLAKFQRMAFCFGVF
jgi:hypothetical protein